MGGDATIVLTSKRFLRKEKDEKSEKEYVPYPSLLDFSYAVAGKSPPRDQQISVSIGEQLPFENEAKEEEINLFSWKLESKNKFIWEKNQITVQTEDKHKNKDKMKPSAGGEWRKNKK